MRFSSRCSASSVRISPRITGALAGGPAVRARAARAAAAAIASASGQAASQASQWTETSTVAATLIAYPWGASATRVLRDALLRSAPQDEENLYVALMTYLILRSPRS